MAIWPAFDHDVDRVTVFVAGLSGETQSVKNPVTNEEVSVRKTLMIEYGFPGTGGREQDTLYRHTRPRPPCPRHTIGQTGTIR